MTWNLVWGSREEGVLGAGGLATSCFCPSFSGRSLFTHWPYELIAKRFKKESSNQMRPEESEAVLLLVLKKRAEERGAWPVLASSDVTRGWVGLRS